MFFWVTFKDRKSGCVEGEGGGWYGKNHKETRLKVLEVVRDNASKFGEVVDVDVLPYPANPRLYVQSDCPSFCWNPEGCKGRTSCPRSRACDD